MPPRPQAPYQRLPPQHDLDFVQVHRQGPGGADAWELARVLLEYPGRDPPPSSPPTARPRASGAAAITSRPSATCSAMRRRRTRSSLLAARR